MLEYKDMETKLTIMDVYEHLESNKEKLREHKVQIEETKIQEALRDASRYNRERQLRLARQMRYYNKLKNKDRTLCECGSSVSVFFMKKHLNTKKHKHFIEHIKGGTTDKQSMDVISSQEDSEETGQL
jgi:hypothetical protein